MLHVQGPEARKRANNALSTWSRVSQTTSSAHPPPKINPAPCPRPRCSLPPRLGLLAPTLRVVLLEGNAICTIRRPILERGTQALLEYLHSRIPS